MRQNSIEIFSFSCFSSLNEGEICERTCMMHGLGFRTWFSWLVTNLKYTNYLNYIYILQINKKKKERAEDEPINKA
jgi:hypothetical protein